MARIFFTASEMEKGLKTIGLKEGDLVFAHCNLPYFGIPEGGPSDENYKKTVLDPLLSVIGSSGTFISPTFTYSFPAGENYDPLTSPTPCGRLSDIILKDPRTIRSLDPIFSVGAIGAKASSITKNLSSSCFGKDSIWDRFMLDDGIIVGFNFGVATTFLHYVERSLNVPYRYDKVFPGIIINNGHPESRYSIYFCSDLSNELSHSNWLGIEKIARESGVLRCSSVGRGEVTAIKAQDLFNLALKGLKSDPFLLTNARGLSSMHTEANGSLLSSDDFNSLDLISDGFSSLLNSIHKEGSLTIHSYPTGSRGWGWIVPEKWKCEQVALLAEDGKQIFSNDKISAISYSQSCNRIVTNEELKARIYPSNPNLTPNSSPCLFYNRDWGIEIPSQGQESLVNSKYKVQIRSKLSIGQLQIGEIVIKGETNNNLIITPATNTRNSKELWLHELNICLHIVKKLKINPTLKITYRLLITPDAFGTLQYLARNEDILLNLPFCNENNFYHNGLFRKITYSAANAFDDECIKQLKENPVTNNIIIFENAKKSSTLVLPVLGIDGANGTNAQERANQYYSALMEFDQ